MRRAAGKSAAGFGAVAALGSAVVCVALLAGCRAQAADSQPPADGVLTPASVSASAGTSTSAAPVNGAANLVSSTPAAPSDAGLDSDLNAVDGQLSGLDSALAQATQSPSDGG